MPNVQERDGIPALVGRKEAAALLGVKPENIYRIEGVPRPLQDRRIKGFNVSTGPLWPRIEIEELVKLVRAEKAKTEREAKRKRVAREREKRKRATQRKARALAGR